MEEVGLKTKYEPYFIPYIIPTERHKYKPDWVLIDNEDFVFEAKGILDPADRKKLLLLKEQYPNKTFYLLFGNAREKLQKNKKRFPITYGDWADHHGFKWCDFYREGIPEEWLNEIYKCD